jgi:hypothetical protein
LDSLQEFWFTDAFFDVYRSRLLDADGADRYWWLTAQRTGRKTDGLVTLVKRGMQYSSGIPTKFCFAIAP